jgi:hypothetical protein
MGRIRTIKPDFFFDTELSGLSSDTKLAFIGLWCHADREGRLEDNPSKLRALIFPYKTKVDMDDILKQLSVKPFIFRYSINSKSYIQIVRWQEHQRCHHSELPSCIPPPIGDITVTTPLQDGNEPAGREGKGKEGKGDDNHTPSKVLHREFVYLTKEQYDLLVDYMGEGNVDSYIDRLNDYIGAKGKRYNSHYHVIRGWFRRDNPERREYRKL